MMLENEVEDFAHFCLWLVTQKVRRNVSIINNNTKCSWSS